MPNKQTKISNKKTRKTMPAAPKHRLEAIDDEMTLNYQKARVGAALPWDHERHAVHEPWAKLSNDIGPRDAGRGIRSGL